MTCELQLCRAQSLLAQCSCALCVAQCLLALRMRIGARDVGTHMHECALHILSCPISRAARRAARQTDLMAKSAVCHMHAAHELNALPTRNPVTFVTVHLPLQQLGQVTSAHTADACC